MPLGTTRAFDINLTDAPLCAPVSLSSRWTTAVAAGGANTADNAGSAVTNPTTQVVNSTTIILTRSKKAGTTFRARLAYAGTPSVDCTIQVFARSGTDAWQLLPNKAGDTSVTLTTAAATDATDGTLFYTAPDPQAHAWDCDGCDDILVAVQTAYAVSAGSAATAYIQGKMI